MVFIFVRNKSASRNLIIFSTVLTYIILAGALDLIHDFPINFPGSENLHRERSKNANCQAIWVYNFRDIVIIH